MKRTNCWFGCPGWCLVALYTCAAAAAAGAADAAGTTAAAAGATNARFYVFFNRDRDRISERSFLETKSIEGAQIKYTWRQLEPRKDEYDFAELRHDLAFLASKGKRLFVQIQDASFDPAVLPVPRYLLEDPQYHGGADPQYEIPDDDEGRAAKAGWVARRWDPAVRERFHRLLLALGREFDGQVEGVNLPETAVEFGASGGLFPEGFTRRGYHDAVVSTMGALKRAFPTSVAMQYANFMPEEEGDEGRTYLRSVYRKAAELKVGVGGPDLLPHRPWQMRHSYPLIRERAAGVPAGVAVQDGNCADINRKTGERVTVPGLAAFAAEYLRADYVFWGTEEPYYSRDVIPFLRGQGGAQQRK